jgi:hypothetical protein
MNVTSAVRDSRVTLPIMPKAPFSVNVVGGRPGFRMQIHLSQSRLTSMKKLHVGDKVPVWVRGVSAGSILVFQQ